LESFELGFVALELLAYLEEYLAYLGSCLVMVAFGSFLAVEAYLLCFDVEAYRPFVGVHLTYCCIVGACFGHHVVLHVCCHLNVVPCCIGLDDDQFFCSFISLHG